MRDRLDLGLEEIVGAARLRKVVEVFVLGHGRRRLKVGVRYAELRAGKSGVVTGWVESSSDIVIIAGWSWWKMVGGWRYGCGCQMG